MDLILVGSHTSPFVRKLRLYMLYNKIEFSFKPINYLEKNDSQYLVSVNPINKIPLLLIDNKPLYDSRIIFNYLNKNFLKNTLSLDDENTLTCIDSLMEATINLFMLKRSGINLEIDNPYFQRQKNRISDLLKYLEPWASTNNEWNYLTMSFYSFIDWATFREMIKPEEYEYLKQFINKFKNKSFIQETKIIA